MNKPPAHAQGETKVVGIWIRVSTEDQAQGESPRHHEQRAREYAKFNGWEVREVYDLSGVSGKTVMDQPETKRMLADIKRGHISALIFSKLARLARNKHELEDFAELFRASGADMISLQEKIDTSTPAGRLFYSIIAAMAHWEREEIADRVNASIKIRAKLGKSLGGPAPFGYMWEDNRLVINPTEAPIRKLMYELFVEQKRKKGVARLLNKAGYRTRKGASFTDTTVVRLLQDTTAKGFYRANHTYRDDKGKLLAKPESEWVFTPVEPIVSEDLWRQCNDLLDERKGKRPPGPKPTHLFAGLLFCGCGQKMYVFSRSPKYVCPKCRNKIPIEDIEAVFRGELESFFVSKEKVLEHLSLANGHLADKKQRLAAHTHQIEKVRTEMRKVYQLYQTDQVSPEGFGKLYRPLEAQERSLAVELPKLQGEIDALEMQQTSADEVIAEATNLHKLWPKFTDDEKRRIVEGITEKIVVSGDEIDITLCYMPSSEELTKRQRNLSDSSPPPA
ncbi:MAG TPA: recombinase family protein [Candidatus Angelobacter sp.]|nr:recombinase family protein [Candidatus Angelobacter sp.]